MGAAIAHVYVNRTDLVLIHSLTTYSQGNNKQQTFAKSKHVSVPVLMKPCDPFIKLKPVSGV